MRLADTALSDLAANIFAALLLVLLVLIQAGRAGPPVNIDARGDLHGLSRAPLRPAEIVGLLYDRRPGAPGLSLDLTAGGSSTRDAELAGQAGPVRLYVFSHAHYASTVAQLRRTGLAWREISVPGALRGGDGDSWSEGFLALLAQRPSAAEFRAGLARLLAAGSSPPQGRGGGTAGAADPLAPLWRLGLHVIAIVCVAVGLAAVLLVEILVPPAQPRYDAGRAERSASIPGNTDHD